MNPNGNIELLTRPLTLKDLKLQVNVLKDTEVTKDVNCDSTFMMNTMNKIGTSIRSHYSFLPKTTPIYLFMDNAGGHGKTEIK